jgi:inner membrane protein
VDPGTHALASLAFTRGFFPRRSWRFVLGVLLAGTLADLDLLTLLSGPSAYLSGRFTVTHSMLGTFAVVAAAFAAIRMLQPKASAAPNRRPAHPEPPATILLAATLAAGLHIWMDLATPSGVAILWPFDDSRFASDLVSSTDPWILALLLAGILLPELFGLVGSEIGAKDKAPRGRNGAILSLALVIIYLGARATLHAGATAQLDAHSYRGESPKRVAAIPDTLSLVTWHGVVETTTQICTISVPAAESARFDPESGVCVHKPEPSAALTVAQQTETATRFLRAARFPKASVGATDDGTEIAIRDMQNAAEQETRYALAARVLLEANGQVRSQRIVWARTLRLR